MAGKVTVTLDGVAHTRRTNRPYLFAVVGRIDYDAKVKRERDWATRYDPQNETFIAEVVERVERDRAKWAGKRMVFGWSMSLANAQKMLRGEQHPALCRVGLEIVPVDGTQGL